MVSGNVQRGAADSTHPSCKLSPENWHDVSMAAREAELRGAPQMVLGRVVSVLAAVLIAIALFRQTPQVSVIGLVFAGVALAAWVLIVVAPTASSAPRELWCWAFMVVGGAVGAILCSELAVIPALMAVLLSLVTPSRPLAVGLSFAGAAALIFGIVAWSSQNGDNLPIVFISLAAVVVLSLSRRQTRVALQRERQIAAELVEAHKALAASAAHDERARIARNLHDVLAHSLGGLVVQLDVLEALAEQGRVDEMLRHAQAARNLAVEGLREARAAVRAFDADEQTDLSTLVQQLEALVATERGFGVEIEAVIHPATGTAAAEIVVAVREAAREALTNARKHAPHEPVELFFRVTDGVLSLTIANSKSAVQRDELVSAGSGFGLRGLRDRCAAIGALVTVADEPDRFVIGLEVRVE